MGGVEGADRPFAVVHGRMVEGTQANRVFYVSQPAEFPRSQVVDLAPRSNDRATRGLAPAVTG